MQKAGADKTFDVIIAPSKVLSVRRKRRKRRRRCVCGGVEKGAFAGSQGHSFLPHGIEVLLTAVAELP